MKPRLTLATTLRVLRQLQGDHRTLALLIVVPCVLIGLMAWMYDGTPVFDRIGPALLGIFPFVVMFLITSITTLRERSSGTLERLLTTPMGRGDLITGYALAFGLVALVQAVVVSAFAIWVCGLDVAGPLWVLVAVAVLVAVLGNTFGLLVSAFAKTEFQAVQFMPALVLPQFLLAGLLMPRAQMHWVLYEFSKLLPLSYAVDAMQSVTTRREPFPEMTSDLLILLGFILGCIVLGAFTLRRRTP